MSRLILLSPLILVEAANKTNSLIIYLIVIVFPVIRLRFYQENYLTSYAIIGVFLQHTSMCSANKLLEDKIGTSISIVNPLCIVMRF